MQYLVQTAASHRIDEIYRYTLSRWGQPQAESYIRGLFDTFEKIGNHTTVSSPVPAAFEKRLTGTCLEELKKVSEGGSVPFTESHGYELGYPKDYIAQFAIDEKLFWQFLETTQGDELEKLQKRGDDYQRKILERYDRLINKHGLLHLLKRGLSVEDAHFTLMYPPPLASSSDRVKENFESNIFSSTRQVNYSLTNPLQEIDMVLFINGMPFATIELKNPWTGQTAR